eukprot:TRINITY_DN103363_c0_g1_i1.p1 TRINITY_DN103363_c0_g1~~TRINITY_DN103363_c0_g1_i1.p1  ORF type:complete len:282 (-),score=53.14 TRINITY_DN103363_c0_g1_i1:422-1267(-)
MHLLCPRRALAAMAPQEAAAVAGHASGGQSRWSAGTALEHARALRSEMPEVKATSYGHLEGADWWDNNKDLFRDALVQYGRKNEAVYRLRPATWGQSSTIPCLRPAVAEALASGRPEALHSVLTPVCEDSCGIKVFSIDLFTEAFCDALVEELEHIEASGIPVRRPNGMNRYGAIMSDLGFQEGLLEPLMKQVCLGKEFTGGDLYFKGVRFTDSQDDSEERRVTHKKGSALLHLGGHFHAALPLTGGDRCNLILWGTGDGGVVRIRPDSPAPKTKTSWWSG